MRYLSPVGGSNPRAVADLPASAEHFPLGHPEKKVFLRNCPQPDHLSQSVQRVSGVGRWATLTDPYW